MSTRNDHTLNPLRPYDDTMWDQFYLYDNIPFEWDSDYEKPITLVSNNLIKSYRCKIKEPYLIKH